MCAADDDLGTHARRTSDGHALAIGYSLGWALWSVYGRLGSWSVSGSLGTDSSSGRGGADNGGYGVEGEKSDAFEDHFMAGVKSLVSLALGGSSTVTAYEGPSYTVLEPG